MPDTVPITDDHIHLQDDPAGTARQFKEAGGTHMFACHLPYNDLPSWEAGYAAQYKRTLSLAKAAREEGVTVYSIVGPYPADLVRVFEAKGVEAAKEHLLDGVKTAMKLIKQGKAVALGEIGRPHFPAPRQSVDACNEVLEEAFAMAKDAGCAVVLHTEGGVNAFMDMAAIADRTGFPKDRLVMHYSPPAVLPEENFGLFPSMLARKGNVEKALAKGNARFMLETDYLDDMRRPGAVLAPATVPKRTLKLLSTGAMTDAQAHEVHCENPSSVYGVDIE